MGVDRHPTGGWRWMPIPLAPVCACEPRAAARRRQHLRVPVSPSGRPPGGSYFTVSLDPSSGRLCYYGCEWSPGSADRHSVKCLGAAPPSADPRTQTNDCQQLRRGRVG